MLVMRKATVALLVCSVAACVPFEPTRPADRASDYTEAGMVDSMTMKDTSVRYDPTLMAVGTARDRVHASLGRPNASRTTDGGLIEDVYAFNPDGSKFVDPQLRARNIALAFLTAGISVAVRQARLVLIERKLTLVHVFYGPTDIVDSVVLEPLSGAPASLPTAG